MIPYGSNHDPPAIVLSVSVAGVVHRRPRVDVPALIDTGADVTAVPETFMEKLKLYPVGRIFIEDANGVMTPEFTYDAFLSLPEKPAKKMEVVLTPYPFVILGRDWLRDYYVLLDGPGQQFELSGEPIRIQET